MDMRKVLLPLIGLIALHGSHVDAANKDATVRAVALEAQAGRLAAEGFRA